MTARSVDKRWPKTTEEALAKFNLRRDTFREKFEDVETLEAPADSPEYNVAIAARENAIKHLHTAAEALRKKGFTPGTTTAIRSRPPRRRRRPSPRRPPSTTPPSR